MCCAANDFFNNLLARQFHRQCFSAEPSPLRPKPSHGGGVNASTPQLWGKDETARYGLPSFKILGASWAVYRRLAAALGWSDSELGLDRWSHAGELRDLATSLGRVELVAATAGNHGRAVAHMAALFGFDARIFVPTGTSEERRAAIEVEGAAVEACAGGYRGALDAAAKCSERGSWWIQDTSDDAHGDVLEDILLGYRTLFLELAEQLRAANLTERPPVLFVPVGVGSLATAAVRASSLFAAPPRIIGVEPAEVASLQASLRGGRLASLPYVESHPLAPLVTESPDSRLLPELIEHGVEVETVTLDEVRRGAEASPRSWGAVSAAVWSCAERWLASARPDADTPLVALLTEGRSARVAR